MGAEKRTITLEAKQIDYIDAKVAAGAYGSASEVVQAGLEALQDRDAVIERWLREEVVPTYERMNADPSSAITAQEMRIRLKRHHAGRSGSVVEK